MEELSRLARNEGEDIALRRKALSELNSREASTLIQLGASKWAMGGTRKPNNYVPGL